MSTKPSSDYVYHLFTYESFRSSFQQKIYFFSGYVKIGLNCTWRNLFLKIVNVYIFIVCHYYHPWSTIADFYLN